MLIDELQKRPFARPLLFWVAGIGLALLFPGRSLLFLSLFGGLCVCLFSVRAGRSEPEDYRFAARRTWGIVFAFFVMFAAVAVTDLAAVRHLSRSASEKGWVHDAGAVRERLAARFDRLDSTDAEKSVLATLTLGDRRTIDREVRTRFAVAGVSHILAVSGFHVAVVCGFLSFLFSFLPTHRVVRRLKIGGMLGLLWGYVVLTGLAPSAVRAGLMLSIYLAGEWLRYPADRYNVWAASAFGMLAYDPFYLLDVGFQLSYSAVFFILFLQPRLARCLRIRNPLLALPWQWLTVAVAAQAGTAFLCLYYFGQFSLVFLFTNLPVAFLSLFLIPAGLLYSLLPVGMPGYGWLQKGVEEGMHALIWTVDRFGAIPGASYAVPFGIVDLTAAYGMLLLAVVYVAERRPWQLLAALGVLLIMLIARLIDRFLLAGY